MSLTYTHTHTHTHHRVGRYCTQKKEQWCISFMS